MYLWRLITETGSRLWWLRMNANDTFVARDVVITITTTGPTGVSITDDVSIPQEGAQGIEVVTDPSDLSDLLTDAGSIDVDVRLLGSATGWSASAAATNPGGFSDFGEHEWWCWVSSVDDKLYGEHGFEFT